MFTKNFSLIKEFRNVITENLNKTSKQFAVDNNFFGPVYHGTTPDKFQKIDLEGFKVFIDDSRSRDIRNGYLNVQYGNTGIPAPIHHLGFGVYFTTSKTIFKKYNLSSTKNIREYYIDAPRLEVINFASPKTMMKWWIENSYDTELAKINRVQATINLTNSLKEKYDAVWFKGKGLHQLLDGDQVVVFNPDKIYQIDPKLSSGKEIGSKVRATKDKFDRQGNLDVKGGSIGTIEHKQPTPPQANWAGESKFIYCVKFKPGGTKYNILDDDIEPLK